MTSPVYWLSAVPSKDDFGVNIVDTFYDARTNFRGMWATMAPTSWAIHAASPALGTGFGQKYVKQADGRWLKVEG